MVVAGIIGAAAGALAPPMAAFVVLIGTLLVAVVWSLVYSFVIYRKLGAVDDLSSPSPQGKA